MAPGRLTVVGTGYNVAGQVTPEALSCLKSADRLFYLMSDPATALWLRSLNAAAEPPHDVGCAHLSCQHFGNRLQHLVAGRMAKCVVDRLQPVDIEQDQGSAGPIALDIGDRTP